MNRSAAKQSIILQGMKKIEDGNSPEEIIAYCMDQYLDTWLYYFFNAIKEEIEEHNTYIPYRGKRNKFDPDPVLVKFWTARILEEVQKKSKLGVDNE